MPILNGGISCSSLVQGEECLVQPQLGMPDFVYSSREKFGIEGDVGGWREVEVGGTGVGM